MVSALNTISSDDIANFKNTFGASSNNNYFINNNYYSDGSKGTQKWINLLFVGIFLVMFVTSFSGGTQRGI